MTTRPDPHVQQLADELWQHYLEHEPYLQLRNGVTVERLPLGSLEEAEQAGAFGVRLLARCGVLQPEALSPSDRLTHALVRDHAERLARTVDTWLAHFPVTPYQLAALHSGLTQALPTAPLASEPDRFLCLVEDVGRAVEVVDDKLQLQQERGWILPAAAFDVSIATVTGLRSYVERVLTAGDEVAPGVADRLERLRERQVLPAFDRVLARLSSADYRDRAPSGIGLGQYPGGFDAYAELARQSVTFPIDPVEVQRQGREQLAELTERRREVRTRLGYADESDFVEHLRTSGRLHARTAQEVEARYLHHVRRIEPLVPQWFASSPRAAYGVERLDPALEAGMTYGYYEPPTAAFPVGRYRYNGSGLDSRSQLNAASLIFHELVPGHHFHVARESEDTSLPLFRSQLPMYGAFNEGWAEYAASLGEEMGLYEDPYDLYGYLVHQSLMTARLVVDTGLNALGMSLEEGRAFLRQHSFESETQIATETLRYSTDWPGQALGYRMGYSQLWEARREAEAALGAAFDVREFHDMVLAPGGRPLPLVRDDVQRWVDSVVSGPAVAGAQA